MVSARRRAQFGVISGGGVFLLAMTIVLAGSLERPRQRLGLPGSSASAFRLPDPQGNILSSRSLNGSVVVLCFAPAPDSNDARQDIDRLAQLGRQYASNKDVKFVALFSGSDDLTPQQARQIRDLADHAGPRCSTLMDPSHRTASRFGISDLPTFLIIDSTGMIRHRSGLDDPSADAPLTSTTFSNVIDLLLAERPARESIGTSGVLSNIK